MPNYVVLIRWTNDGARNAKQAVERARTVEQMTQKVGGKLTSYWTTGQYDVVALFEAPDDETLHGLLLSMCGSGEVHTETLRAFTAEEMQRIFEHMV